MIDFRKVELGTEGALLLHSMPGRLEDYSFCCEAMQAAGVARIVCLNPTEEIEKKSPAYAQAIAEGTLPFDLAHFPIINFGVPDPDKKEAFFNLANEVAVQLERGENVLVHCAGGVGRTGTFAACVTAKLGQPISRVTDAGGKAETEHQLALLAELEQA